MFQDGPEHVKDAENGLQRSIDIVAAAPALERPLLWEAFWDLHTERINSMSLGSIPISKMYWYADYVLGFDLDEVSAFVYILRRLDSFFISKMADKNKQSK